MDKILWEEEYARWKKEAIAVIIMMLICIYCFFLSMSWIINEDYGFSDIDIIQYEDVILEIEEDPIVLYSQDVMCAIKTEKGKTILLTEQISEFIDEKIILSIKKGGKISYKIDSELNNNKYLEVVELYYEGKEIISLYDYYKIHMEGRVTGWFIMPMSIIGFIIFSADLCRCWKYIKKMKQNDDGIFRKY